MCFVAVRTGQAHRTLLGHTGPVTCLQFDEIHIASGSLDKTLRVGLFHHSRLVFSFMLGSFGIFALVAFLRLYILIMR